MNKTWKLIDGYLNNFGVSVREVNEGSVELALTPAYGKPLMHPRIVISKSKYLELYQMEEDSPYRNTARSVQNFTDFLYENVAH